MLTVGYVAAIGSFAARASLQSTVPPQHARKKLVAYASVSTGVHGGGGAAATGGGEAETAAGRGGGSVSCAPGVAQLVRQIWISGYMAAAGSLVGRFSMHSTLPLQHATRKLVR